MSHWLSRTLSAIGLLKSAPVGRSTGAITLQQPAVSVSAGKRRATDVMYPPRDQGIPIQPAQDLLGDQAELIRQLRTHAADTPSVFDTRFQLPIVRLAEHINTLPGSASNAYSGAGGLFRACVETAFAAFRASDGRIFTGALGVEARHRLEGRWRYICFCAGLLYPIGKPLNEMAVLNTSGEKWAPELEPLVAWAPPSSSARVFVTWTGQVAGPGPSSLTGAFALNIIGRENVLWLNQGAPNLVSTLLNLVTGSSTSSDSIAASVVIDMWQAVLDRENARRYQNYGRLTIGSHLSPYIIDAMTSLARMDWELNKKTLYADATGVYLVWPTAVDDIIRLCLERQFQGIPTNVAALLPILIAEGIVEAGANGAPIVEIADADGEVVPAIKLKQPGLLLPEGKTLASFDKSRPVLMAEVNARDPLSGAMAGLSTNSGAGTAIGAKPAARSGKASPVLDQLDIAEIIGGSHPPAPSVDGGRTDTADAGDQEGDADDDESAEEEHQTTLQTRVDASNAQQNGLVPAAVLPTTPATETPPNGRTSKPKQPPPAAVRRPADPGAVVEAPEIKYSNLVPTEVLARFRPHESELIGRLVHIWRTKANDGRVMRMCESGLAVELLILSDLTRDPATFLTALGKEGLLYTAPSTPAKMIYPVPVVEGSTRSQTCFILAHHALKKLGLP